MKNLTASYSTNTVFSILTKNYTLPVHRHNYACIAQNKIYINHFCTTVSATTYRFYNTGTQNVSKIISTIFHSSGLS